MNYFPATADNASVATTENNQIVTTGNNSIAAKNFWNIKTKWPGGRSGHSPARPLRILFRYGASQASQAAPTFLHISSESDIQTGY